MLEAHWQGVIRWHHSPRVQRAAGRTELAHPGGQATSPRVPLSRNYKTMIYLVAGKLNAGPQLA